MNVFMNSYHNWFYKIRCGNEIKSLILAIEAKKIYSPTEDTLMESCENISYSVRSIYEWIQVELN